MAWSLAGVVAAAGAYLRGELAPVPVYDAGAVDEWRIPPSVSQLPSVLVYPGATQSNITRGGQTRTWELTVDILAGRADVGLDARAALVLADAVVSALLGRANLAPGAWWTSLDVSGLVPLDWGGITWVGVRVSAIIVEEQTVEVQP
jgi:hypothetical protein